MAKGVFNRITLDWQFYSWSSTKLSTCYSISGRGRSNACRDGRTEWRIDSQFHGGLTVSSPFGGRARNGSLITFSFGPGNAFYCVSTYNCIQGEGSISSNTPPSSPSLLFDYISDTDTRLNLLLIWSG